MRNAAQNTWKATIRLAEIDPSEDNPRRDLGDIPALAERIRATGGQPINPIVCVRDGERYRIVDGERRYRALMEIYGGEGSTSALVFSDYSAAHAAVAMLATDDKKPLSREEQARGFQTMMRLDVPMADAARATGIGAEELRRARRSLAAASRLAEGTQATMDAMIAAGSAEFSEEERAEILASQWPDDKAAEISKSHRRAERLEAIRLALPDGVGFGTEEDARGAKAGLLYVAQAKSAKAAREIALEDGKDYVALPPEYELYPAAWTVYEVLPDGEEAPSDDEVRRAREAEERAEHASLLRHMRTHMMSWLLDNLCEADLKPIEERVGAAMKRLETGAYDLGDEDAELVGALERAAPTWREVVLWLDDRVREASPAAWEPYYYYGDDERIVGTWDALVECGWEPDELDRRVRDACRP